MKLKLFLFLLFISFFSCQDDPISTTPSGYAGPLFSRINATESGVDFANMVPQDARKNVLFYEYYLNGGGVAVADFNKDGLPDLFFTSNMDADQLYINKGNFEFEDITKEAGVEGWRDGNRQSWSTGATITDVNNDGWLDLYVCKSGAYQNPTNKANLLYINNGTKRMKGIQGVTFTEQSIAYNVQDAGHSVQAVFFDADKDKDLDLYVMNHSILYKEDLLTVNSRLTDENFVNQFSGQFYTNENGKFVNSTKNVGMNRYGFGLGLVASDLNHDGYTDVYVSNDFSESDFMFINQGNGTFANQMKENIKHSTFYGKGIDAADINNDGLLDICNMDIAATSNVVSKTAMPYMDARFYNTLLTFFKHSYQYMYNCLQLNQGNGRFSEIAKLAGVDKTDWSWGVLLADFDNDSHKDIFVSNGYKSNSMNNDFITEFKDIKDLWAVISESEKVDLINRIPSHKTPNVLFKNKGNLQFESINKDWGMQEPNYSYGAAYADLDMDGDLDLVVNNMDEKAGIYRNNSQNTNYLQIDLQDRGQHLPATCWNATVTIHTTDGLQYQELTPVRGYQASVEPILHFGLGTVTNIDKIEVQWQDGSSQILENIAANQRLIIDKKKASNQSLAQDSKKLLFQLETNPGDLFKHTENRYNDFDEEALLPHLNSRQGPALSQGDVNGDGLVDYFIGGASQQSGALLIQQRDGKFLQSSSNPWSAEAISEDMGSVFFDVDKDGDLDLYIVSGGNEFSVNSIYLQDRVYLNDGKGTFTKGENILPDFTESGSTVVAADFNGDGWTDIFVGGRMQVQQYPMPAASKIFINQNGKLLDKTQEWAAILTNIGIVTTAKAVDFNQDEKIDLVIGGEWMPIKLLENTGSTFKDSTPSILNEQTGWWSAIESGDFDKDGDVDFILGNWGLNHKYKASSKAPFHIYYDDFDDSGTKEIILGYYNQGTCFPVRGREYLSQQMPSIKSKFPDYQSFAKADIATVLGEKINTAYHQQASNFASSYLRNDGKGQFELIALPNEAQLSSVNGIVLDDFNKDGHLDALLAGNMYDTEIQTPRNDSSVGICLLGDGKGNFTALAAPKSGFFADGNIKDMIQVKGTSQNNIVVANNNQYTGFFYW